MDILGKGAYGQVVKHQNTAVKQYQRLPALIQEYVALTYLKDCKYIVKTLGVDYQKLTLTMELYELNLRQWISNECCCEKCINRIIYCVLRGIIELQDRSLSHSDLKPSNILIRMEPFKLVLGDCGFVSRANYSKQQRTAHSYRDIVIENDDKHDMFSLGVILLELLYHIKPEVRNSYNEFQQLIKTHVTDKNHKTILSRLMNEDRTHRPDAREVMSLLFNKSPPVFTKPPCPHYQEIYDKIIVKYKKDNIESYEQTLHDCWKHLDVNRGRMGLKGLFIYLLEKDREEKVLSFYLAATCIILSSTFGNHQPNLSELMIACKVDKKYKSKVMRCIRELTRCEEFVKAVFS